MRALARSQCDATGAEETLAHTNTNASPRHLTRRRFGVRSSCVLSICRSRRHLQSDFWVNLWNQKPNIIPLLVHQLLSRKTRKQQHEDLSMSIEASIHPWPRSRNQKWQESRDFLITHRQVSIRAALGSADGIEFGLCALPIVAPPSSSRPPVDLCKSTRSANQSRACQ